jgi:NAD(P)-dependent dehydrogenase (short-subunit alcohol dehydrogenase family)
VRIRESVTPSEDGLAGKVAIVTGAAQGIGRGIALHLARLGAAVVVADQNAQKGKTVVREIQHAGGQARLVEFHLERSQEAARPVKEAMAAFGDLHILVNSAATLGNLKPLTHLKLEEWQKVIATNLTGTFLISQMAARHMQARKRGGSIINILAIQALSPIPCYGAYSTSKGGLEALTRAFAVELADKGIRVNGIEVGAVYTSAVNVVLPRAWLRRSDDPETVATKLDKVAPTLIGRIGRPSDIAHVVAFLASDQAAFLAGTIIRADGGRMLSRKPDPLTKLRGRKSRIS